MCLYTYALAIQVAKRDITVYKVINCNNTSAIRQFQYEPNKLYRLRKPLVPKHATLTGDCTVIDDGFHSFELHDRAYNHFKNCYAPHEKCKLVEFVIPKGAKYILGMHGDIVSTSIRSGSLDDIS